MKTEGAMKAARIKRLGNAYRHAAAMCRELAAVRVSDERKLLLDSIRHEGQTIVEHLAKLIDDLEDESRL